MKSKVPAPPRPRLVYHNRDHSSSIWWLIMALFFGGGLVCAYFSTEKATLWTLIIGVAVGVPMFTRALVLLGRYQALILFPVRRQLKYVEGFFHRRSVSPLDYTEVRAVRLVTALDHYEIQLGRVDGDTWGLDEGVNLEDARQQARDIAREVGVEVEEDIRPLTDVTVSSGSGVGY